MDRTTAYFVSDAHFGIRYNKPTGGENDFIELLNEIAMKGSHLFIVGDLFDFWIEYRHAIRPDYFWIVHELRKLVEKGIEIHYLAGNHDFALGPFLEKKIGIVIHHRSITISIQGKRLYLYHGDGLRKSDRAFRILRMLLRNPINQWFYRLLHPNIGIPIGSFLSGSRRKYLGPVLTEDTLEEYRQCAYRILNDGSDVVFFGHTHHGEIVPLGENVYCNTGDWLVHQNYATMTDGLVTLWRYQRGTAPERIPPIQH